MSLLLLLVCALACAVIRKKARFSRFPLPPGPRGKFFTGVKAMLPASEPWRKYSEWAARYGGPITSFRVYNRRIFILNTRTAVHDLLERRAEIYSERPVSWMYHVICGRAHSVFNISASHPRHKIYRRLLRSGLSAEDVKSYYTTLEHEAAVLTRGLCTQPREFETHIRRNSAAVIMKIAFGYSISENDDPFISIAEQSSKISGWAMEPGRWLVDCLPILRFIPSWFPFAGFKRQGAQWRLILDGLSDVPHNWVKSQIAAGTASPSFTAGHLHQEMTEEEEDMVKWCAGALYAGAADTTVSATISFIMLMALHPAIQTLAQKEIESITGGAIPRAADIYRYPYLSAVLKEVLRYAPVANLALPHQVAQEDTYAGCRVPAGTMVIPNVWAIMHDPDLYPDPFVFNPERFIHSPNASSAAENAIQPDPNKYAWGFGRRACPGKHLAESVLLFNMASILYSFTITPESHAQRIESIKFTTGHTSCVKPFAVRFAPRISET